MLKEAMSSFDIAAVTAELESTLEGSQINNIYQINPKTFLLKLRGHEGTYAHLLVEAGKRIHTTSYVFEKPSKPPNFCVVLRKFLENGRVAGLQQHEFERIVEIKVQSRDSEYRLIIELFEEGNIILAGPDNKILHALTYRKMRDRNILRGEGFAYPPPKGKSPRNLQREDLSEIGDFGQLEVVKALTRVLGIGGLYAEEILLRAGLAKNTPCSSVKDEDLDAIFSGLQGLLAEIASGNEKPCIFVDADGNWVDVAAFPLQRYGALKHVSYRTFNEALDEYYAKAAANQKVSEAKEPVEQSVARLERILQDQEKNLQDLKRKAEAYSKIGDAIYRHFSGLDMLVQRMMRDKRSGKDWPEIVEAVQKEKEQSAFTALYFQSVKPEELALQVSVEDQVFDLNLKQSAQENAAAYYEAAKKAKKKMEGLEAAIKQSREKIEKTRLKIVEKADEASGSQLKMEKREWYEKFRWFHSSGGVLVIGGRDASTNEIIVKKHMEPQDIVFHADVAGAPFVVIKTQGKMAPEQTLKEAAQFAASYSRAWKEGLSAINVYWVPPQQISQHPPSGQYLAKGAFMIYGTKNYVKNVPLEVAIGTKKEDGRLRIIGGPPAAVARQASILVKIVPGKEASGKLAKQVKAKLAHMASAEERGEVLKIRLEEIQRFIPSGLGSTS
jgi:predicted ribosome quality control (RQC) complex YloA/Tae2 family protein